MYFSLFVVAQRSLNTITKRTVANARNGVGDGDGLQGGATIKRKAANARHGVGDGNGLQG